MTSMTTVALVPCASPRSDARHPSALRAPRHHLHDGPRCWSTMLEPLPLRGHTGTRMDMSIRLRWKHPRAATVRGSKVVRRRVDEEW
ncbi:hypothetical protein DFH06DRAFT_1486828, partial [Mycena polygramma]